MNKKEAISHFGGVKQTAVALGVTRQAVERWPDELTQRIQDRIVGAMVRLHLSPSFIQITSLLNIADNGS